MVAPYWFDPTVNLGAIINLIGFVVGGLVFAITLRSDLRALVQRVSRLEQSSDAMETALTKLAVQDERLNSHARRIEALEARTHR